MIINRNKQLMCHALQSVSLDSSISWIEQIKKNKINKKSFKHFQHWHLQNNI